MPPAPIPEDEIERLAALWSLGLLDTAPEEVFERLVHVAQRLTGQAVAALSLVDRDRQWWKAVAGVPGATPRSVPRDVSFCAHTIAGRTLDVIDTHADPRFYDNPMVLGPPYIRAYYGRTVHGPTGHALGALCVLGVEPAVLNDAQLVGLGDLARVIEELIRLRSDWKLLPPP